MKKITCESCGANDFNVFNSSEMQCSYCGTLYLRDAVRDTYIPLVTSTSGMYVYPSSSRIAIYPTYARGVVID